ncbi:phosphotransferase [Aquihabitans sp. McL0605]|uniref:phosphotransferase n=1 Tax=Aquihabitans sp. McL0605 TaxID=3415671 RepID=UPI003CE9ACEE
MTLLRLAGGPKVDNRPGAPACPPWLFHLDDPAPASVLFVGSPAPGIAEWFREQGAVVEVVQAADVGGRAAPELPPPAELLVLGHEASSAASGPLHETAWLGRTGAVVLARRPEGAWVDALAQADLGTIRAVGPEQPAGRRRAHARRPHVATRTAAPDRTAPGWLDAVVAGAIARAAATRGEPALDPAGRPVDLPAVAPAATWSLHVPSAYPSQKAIARVHLAEPEPRDLIVKLTRHPRFNARLQNEAGALDSIEHRGGVVAERIPQVVATMEVAGLTASVHEAIAGHPFLHRSTLRVDCPLAADAVAAITELGAATVRVLPPVNGDHALHDLHRRFVERQHPSVATAAFLADQVALLADEPMAGVLFHGDLGTWNLMVDEHERVRILDWESAELPGPPLWDLFYFTRSFAVRAGRRRGLDRNRAIGRHLLGSSTINHQAAQWVEQYRARLGIEPHLVEPLLHTCWMHRAVKEQSRLPEGDTGHYGPLCVRMVEHRNAPGLRRLVGG